ncbi:MAG: hypothetical protein H6851_08260 [Geminicoccaceae bacterium]|nr:hypothetical protein [Geminicoccaceae bacterium]MCB9943595.1 hypothetical protein [Geminicoccaceae bacterium]
MPSQPESVTSDRSGLLDRPVEVVNIGLELFADELRAAGIPVTHVEWTPPAGGDPQLAALLARLGV